MRSTLKPQGVAAPIGDFTKKKQTVEELMRGQFETAARQLEKIRRANEIERQLMRAGVEIAARQLEKIGRANEIERQMSLGEGSPTAAAGANELSSVAETAILLRCSVSQICAAISDGQPHALRIGRGRKRGRFLIRKSAINAWLQKRELQTAAEIRARR